MAAGSRRSAPGRGKARKPRRRSGVVPMGAFAGFGVKDYGRKKRDGSFTRMSNVEEGGAARI
jgi:hypothetical protein